MSEDQKNPKRYFGWYTPKPDGTSDLARANREFTEENWQEFSRIVGVTAELRPLVIDYVALETALGALIDVCPSLIEAIETAEHIMLFTGVPQVRALATAQGALSNFLAATSSLRDRARTRIRKTFGKGSLETLKFKAAETDSYDASFAYRLFYNLRNFAQHEDLPISTIPVNVQRDEAGKYKAEVRLIIRPQELMDSDLVQKSFREKDLKHLTIDLELLPLAQEVFVYHGAIVRTVIELYAERLTEMQHYARVIVEKLKVPKGSIPVVWEGDPPSRHHHFSFDELGFLVILYEKLRNNGITLGPQPVPAPA